MSRQLSEEGLKSNGDNLKVYWNRLKSGFVRLQKQVEEWLREVHWEDFKEYSRLFLLSLLVYKRNLVEYIKVIFKYYLSSLTFVKADLWLLGCYIYHSPFYISKRFLKNKGEQDLYTYGETPLTTLEHIVKTCGISASDVVYEVGSGRGRVCFWLNSFIGCRVVGVERIPEFITFANKVKDKFSLERVEFRLQDVAETDFSGATVVYLYGTCLEDNTIEALTKRFEKLPSGTKIITVSYSLNDYTTKPVFEVMKLFPARFTWGEGDVYLHRVK